MTYTKYMSTKDIISELTAMRVELITMTTTVEMILKNVIAKAQESEKRYDTQSNTKLSTHV